MCDLENNETPASDVTMPGSLTDVAKALRELIGLFHDVKETAIEGVEWFRARSAGKTAESLDFISFKADGFLDPLTRIESGSYTDLEFKKLKDYLAETQRGVEERIRVIHAKEKEIRRIVGAELGSSLLNSVYGKYGKFEIRKKIEDLVQLKEKGANKKNLQKKAKDIIKMIDNLNKNLWKLHDLLFPPKPIK
ncbi:MAG: hypothetical protein NXI02_03150 [Rhodobacteraceae bacterium]|nr:hypothetical protein [Paracoccaceae bacterium]